MVNARLLFCSATPSLGFSFLIAILPVAAVLVLLGVLRRPAWQAALAGLVVADRRGLGMEHAGGLAL